MKQGTMHLRTEYGTCKRLVAIPTKPLILKTTKSNTGRAMSYKPPKKALKETCYLLR